MKITPADFESLQTALMETLNAHQIHPFMVKTSGHAWQVFHKAWNEKRIDGNALYKKYNDSHIETALKRIFK